MTEKITHEQFLQKLKDIINNSSNKFTIEDLVEDSDYNVSIKSELALALNELDAKCVYNERGDGNDNYDTTTRVFYFPNQNCYVKISTPYSSYSDWEDWDVDNLHLAEKKEMITTYYQII